MINAEDYKVIREEQIGGGIPDLPRMMEIQLLTYLVQHAVPHLGEGPGDFSISNDGSSYFVDWIMHHKDGWDSPIEIRGFEISVIQETLSKLLIFPATNKTMFKEIN